MSREKRKRAQTRVVEEVITNVREQMNAMVDDQPSGDDQKDANIVNEADLDMRSHADVRVQCQAIVAVGALQSADDVAFRDFRGSSSVPATPRRGRMEKAKGIIAFGPRCASLPRLSATEVDDAYEKTKDMYAEKILPVEEETEPIDNDAQYTDKGVLFIDETTLTALDEALAKHEKENVQPLAANFEVVETPNRKISVSVMTVPHPETEMSSVRVWC